MSIMLPKGSKLKKGNLQVFGISPFLLSTIGFPLEGFHSLPLNCLPIALGSPFLLSSMLWALLVLLPAWLFIVQASVYLSLSAFGFQLPLVNFLLPFSKRDYYF